METQSWVSWLGFDDIVSLGTHGTLICIYNVKLLDNGDPELGKLAGIL